MIYNHALTPFRYNCCIESVPNMTVCAYFELIQSVNKEEENIVRFAKTFYNLHPFEALIFTTHINGPMQFQLIDRNIDYCILEKTAISMMTRF